MALSDEITEFLRFHNAHLIGFADLANLPAAPRCNMPRAVSFAFAMEPEIVAGIKDGPTAAYYAEYRTANVFLGELSRATADLIREHGFSAVSSAATDEGIDPKTYSTELPHKTVATLAGLGWIGKSALLVNEQFGSAIRLNRVLTDAPLPTAAPITESRCGDCRACVEACPARAATGVKWSPDKRRDDIFDVFACRRTARETAKQKTGITDTFCGICIAACPWTQAYINASAKE
jgi:epoxyqueuosine reductase